MKLLGIDLGKASIKGVLLEATLNRYSVQGYYEQNLASDKTIPESIQLLLRQIPYPVQQIVIGLPNQVTTLRNLEFPTRSKKAIQNGIAFELEDELPFLLEQTYYDYTTLSQSKKGCWIHVAISLKNHVSSFLELFQSAQLDPPYLTTEAWAYKCLMNRILGKESQVLPHLLMDIGQDKTALYLHGDNRPLFILDLPWGERTLTQGIAEKYEISLEEAEMMKKEQGLFSPHLASEEKTKDQQKLIECLEKASLPLLQEIRQANLIAKTMAQYPVAILYLTGETALLPGFKEWLEEKVSIPVQYLLPLSRLDTTANTSYSPETDARFALAAALAISIVGSDKTFFINFRKQIPLKSKSHSDITLKSLIKPLTAIGVILFCMMGSLTLQNSIYKDRLEKANSRLEKSLKRFFGTLSKGALKTYLSNHKFLRESVRKEIEENQDISHFFGPDPKNPLNVLGILSREISKGLILDLTEFSIDEDPEASADVHSTTPSLAASFTFVINEPQQAEKLKKVLKGILNNLNQTELESISTGVPAQPKWKVTFTGRLQENAYEF